MDMKAELAGPREQDELVVAHLAIAYALLALAPYDSWSHEGSPAEMAVYVVKEAKAKGNMARVHDVVLGRKR